MQKLSLEMEGVNFVVKWLVATVEFTLATAF